MVSDAYSESSKMRAVLRKGDKVSTGSINYPQNSKKLSPLATSLSLVKAMVNIGVLVMPSMTLSAGWAFWLFALTFSAYLTYICLDKLVEVKARVGGTYDELAE
mmetsp:Transcript_12942/g.17781  ORF Transcript_12942/g.17781 Transcript_12942/m.17781 type:complete len:104 (-) Transcript_12942:210-521(-)